ERFRRRAVSAGTSRPRLLHCGPAVTAERAMDHHKLVLPEHINHYGFLFGGHLLQWIDEFAYITATVDYPGLRFVTVAMKDVQFKRRIGVGEVLRFAVNRSRTGQTSVQYRVRAHGLVV